MPLKDWDCSLLLELFHDHDLGREQEQWYLLLVGLQVALRRESKSEIDDLQTLGHQAYSE